MVLARDRFLASGAYAPLKDSLAQVVTALPHTHLLDVGCGTGYYLGSLMETLGAPTVGLGFDTATRAVRLAARAHPDITAFTWDVFRDFPLMDSTIDVVLDVFSPRNGPEFYRVLAPGGHTVVVTPEPQHLQELRASTDMVGIDPRKDERLNRALHMFKPVRESVISYDCKLTPDLARDLIFMTPSARHLSKETVTDSQLPTSATVAVKISVWRKPTERQ